MPRNIFLKWCLAKFTKEGIEIYAIDQEMAKDIRNRHLRLSGKEKYNEGIQDIPLGYNLIVLYRALIERRKVGLNSWSIDEASLAIISKMALKLNFISLVSMIDDLVDHNQHLIHISNSKKERLGVILGTIRYLQSLSLKKQLGFNRLEKILELLIDPKKIKQFSLQNQINYELYCSGTEEWQKILETYNFIKISNSKGLSLIDIGNNEIDQEVSFYVNKRWFLTVNAQKAHDEIKEARFLYVDNITSPKIFIIYGSESINSSALKQPIASSGIKDTKYKVLNTNNSLHKGGIDLQDTEVDMQASPSRFATGQASSALMFDIPPETISAWKNGRGVRFDILRLEKLEDLNEFVPISSDKKFEK